MKKQRGMTGRKPMRLPWLKKHAWFDGDECLYWPFKYSTIGKRDNGGAQVMFKGRYVRAARVMCELAHGPAPTPKHESAHSCGDSRCFNQKHLRWATKFENEADKDIHGKRPRGVRVNAKLGHKGFITKEKLIGNAI
jgi:hypothetical protein